MSLVSLLAAILMPQVWATWEDDIVEGSLDGFHSLQEIQDLMASAGSDHSTYVTTSQNSYVKIHHPDSGEDVAVVVVSAAQFAGFPYGPQLAAYLIEKLTEDSDDEDVRILLASGTVLVYPVVNSAAITQMETTYADKGFEPIYKNLNADFECSTDSLKNGVNLNRNWESGFAAGQDVCSEEYSGSTAFSEDETQTLQNLMNTLGISVWIHLDEVDEDFVQPVFNANNPATYFYEQVEDIPGVSLDESSGNGTLIDYALNAKDIYSVEVDVGSNKEIDLSDLEDYYDQLIEILKLGMFKLEDPVSKGSTNECGGTYTCGTNITEYYTYTLSLKNSGMSAVEMKIRAEYSEDTHSILQTPTYVIQDLASDSNRNGEASTITVGSEWYFLLDAHSEAEFTVNVEPSSTGRRLDIEDVEFKFHVYPNNIDPDLFEELHWDIDGTGGGTSQSGEEEGGEDADYSRDSLHDGTIAGIIISIIVLIAVIVVVVIFAIKSRKSNAEDEDAPPAQGQHPGSHMEIPQFGRA